VIGRAEGDEVQVEAPRGTWKATIVAIRRSA
jgi:transcription elongation GreA/GreB family factor